MLRPPHLHKVCFGRFTLGGLVWRAVQMLRQCMWLKPSGRGSCPAEPRSLSCPQDRSWEVSCCPFVCLTAHRGWQHILVPAGAPPPLPTCGSKPLFVPAQAASEPCRGGCYSLLPTPRRGKTQGQELYGQPARLIPSVQFNIFRHSPIQPLQCSKNTVPAENGSTEGIKGLRLPDKCPVNALLPDCPSSAAPHFSSLLPPT